jgi:hypothetical protein
MKNICSLALFAILALLLNSSKAQAQLDNGGQWSDWMPMKDQGGGQYTDLDWRYWTGAFPGPWGGGMGVLPDFAHEVVIRNRSSNRIRIQYQIDVSFGGTASEPGERWCGYTLTLDPQETKDAGGIRCLSIGDNRVVSYEVWVDASKPTVGNSKPVPAPAAPYDPSAPTGYSPWKPLLGQWAGLQERVSRGGYNSSARRYEWHVQFKNLYDKGVSLTYKISEPGASPDVAATGKQIDIRPGETNEGSDLVAATERVEIYFGKTWFWGQSDADNSSQAAAAAKKLADQRQQQQARLQEQQAQLQQQYEQRMAEIQRQLSERRQQLLQLQQRAEQKRVQAANQHIARAESYQAAGQAFSSGLQQLGQSLVEQMQRDAAAREAREAQARAEEEAREARQQIQEAEDKIRQQQASLEQEQARLQAEYQRQAVQWSQAQSPAGAASYSAVIPAVRPLSSEPAAQPSASPGPWFPLTSLLGDDAPKPKPGLAGTATSRRSLLDSGQEQPVPKTDSRSLPDLEDELFGHWVKKKEPPKTQASAVDDVLRDLDKTSK